MDTLLDTPLAEKTVRDLRVGDTVYLSGNLFTARDEAHRLLLELAKQGDALPFRLDEMGLFHCGPLARKRKTTWEILSAGPTTSMRMEPHTADLLRTFRPRLIIGKGGMGQQTLTALGEVGAAYAQFTGGAGALAAQSIRRVTGVHWLEELGMVEAVWLFEVDRFGPLVITMDAAGNNAYAEVAAAVRLNLTKIHNRIEEESGGG